MNDGSSSNTFGFNRWTEFWMDTQRRYWDSWLNISRRAYGSPAAAAVEAPENPWLRAWDFWLGLMVPAVGGRFAGSADESAYPAPTFGPWTDLWFQIQRGYWENPWALFGQNVRRMQEDFTASLTAGRNPWVGFANFWGMPLDNWRRVCSAFSMLPGDMEQAVRGYGSPYGPETLHQTMVGVLSMPTVGYTREWQEELQRWGLLWLEHSRSLQAYGAVLVELVQRAFELLGRALAEQSVASEALGSLRGFYDLWIDCGEEAYAEISVSPEFIEAQSRLANSLFAIKRQEQKMGEEVQSAFNIPTRRELDTSHRRVHQLQRRLWQVEQSLEESGGSGLQEEVSALRRELEVLRASLEPEGPKPAPPRRGGGLKTIS
jgi:class III poly(R)-hydroxyalkanoic acid synthase PhaE subunit